MPTSRTFSCTIVLLSLSQNICSCWKISTWACAYGTRNLRTHRALYASFFAFCLSVFQRMSPSWWDDHSNKTSIRHLPLSISLPTLPCPLLSPVFWDLMLFVQPVWSKVIFTNITATWLCLPHREETLFFPWLSSSSSSSKRFFQWGAKTSVLADLLQTW